MLAFMTTVMAPVVSLWCYMYLRDVTYNMFPVIRIFVIGALLVFPVAVLQYAFEVENVFTGILSKSFFLYGFIEEGLKWLMLFIFGYQQSYLKHPRDGILLSVSLALGFATVENGLYLIASGPELVLPRMFFPVASHTIYGIIMGYYMVNAIGQKKKFFYFQWALFIPVFLHGMYDFILMAFEEYFLFVIGPFMILLLFLAYSKLKKTHHLQI
ncbi:PrsW family glutamic-type intramembrane protease [Shouchella lonarensis]|uniref:Protease PrsW n=1 Tax=Shouchella lonarensis TaxID=1464122 RepID=A0A1G6IZS6_9BACI|nr:PrsW family glutamic-type intramembrane protease [Shouchella lonarensis]SDC11994.1 Membrane proteinase PrsW, cleaves anti-sigma factor RsiW, M82 family [Shouchella lonarensis]